MRFLVHISVLCFLYYAPWVEADGSSESHYVEQIEKFRRERDIRFSDPLTSPLAQVGGALLEGPELVFGSSPGADLQWHGSNIESRHLRVVRDGDQVFLEPLEGSVFDLQDHGVSTRVVWEADKMYRAGSVLLVLRRHPVGPIVRILDPQAEKLREFKGLNYFPVDEQFQVKAVIHPRSRKKITISDTQGWERSAWIFGKLAFSLEKTPHALDLVLFDEEPGEESSFLLMFRDQTSGKETYAACRYLHLPFQSEGEVWLDFNKAYNPYCAYADSFACPLPPPGNRLDASITAGERTYSKSSHSTVLKLDN